jgi:putative FmdB family regulatory protein
MPIYEYQCQQCGHHHEALQKLSDSQLRKCPDCGRSSLKRLVSAVRFRLAGSGWYETDFKSDKEGKRNLHEKGDKDEPKPEVKPDTKPEAKPETTGDASAADKAEAKPSTPSESVERKSRTTVTKPSARPSPASPARRKPKAAARKPAARRAKR